MQKMKGKEKENEGYREKNHFNFYLPDAAVQLHDRLGRENLKQKPQPMPRQFSWKSYLPAVWFLEAQLLLREQLQ